MNDWPALPLDEWRETYQTLHMYTQVVGKVRLQLAPPMNHWWQIPLYLTSRGLTTSPMPYGERTLEVFFDFLQHQLIVETSDGERREISLGGSVRDFYRNVMATLHSVHVDVSIWPHPVEVPDPVPFDEDTRHATYNPDHARRFWEVLRRVDTTFKQFRAEFSGKSSPVHFFWGSFDLAVTRFSGRPAPPKPAADPVTLLAYNAQLSSLGFWPGGQGIEGAAFYSYCYPEPPAYRSQPARPVRAAYNEAIGEFLLMYDDVRSSPDPNEAILSFGRSTYEAAARLQDWPSDLVDPAHVG